MACPDEDVIAAYAAGRLKGDEHDAVTAHLAECSSCLDDVASVAAAEEWTFAGRYRVDGLPLGAGATGRVYRAYDAELDHWVALKIFHPELCNHAELVEQFRGEAKLNLRLQHPNVCRVFHLGRDEGQLYLVMDLAKQSLGEELRHKWMDRTLEARLTDARDVLQGLAAIHEAGLVHRDLKPANILRLLNGRLAVSDFGFAVDLKLANGSTRVGTIGYIPPERMSGMPASPRGDVYSMGVVLHELLFGRLPKWEAENHRPQLESLEKAVSSQLQALHALCRACLAYIPLERPSSATVVLQRLSEATDGTAQGQPHPMPAAKATLPAGPAGTGWGSRLSGTLRRRRAPAAVALVLLAAAVATMASRSNAPPSATRSTVYASVAKPEQIWSRVRRAALLPPMESHGGWSEPVPIGHVSVTGWSHLDKTAAVIPGNGRFLVAWRNDGGVRDRGRVAFRWYDIRSQTWRPPEFVPGWPSSIKLALDPSDGSAVAVWFNSKGVAWSRESRSTHSWSQPRYLYAGRVEQIALVVSGDVVRVAWSADTTEEGSSHRRASVYAVSYRAGEWGATTTVDSEAAPFPVVLGVGKAGEALLVYCHAKPSFIRDRDVRALTSVALRDASIGPPHPVGDGERCSPYDDYTLSTAANGSARLFFRQDDKGHAWSSYDHDAGKWLRPADSGLGAVRAAVIADSGTADVAWFRDGKPLVATHDGPSWDQVGLLDDAGSSSSASLLLGRSSRLLHAVWSKMTDARLDVLVSRTRSSEGRWSQEQVIGNGLYPELATTSDGHALLLFTARTPRAACGNQFGGGECYPVLASIFSSVAAR